MLTWPNVFLLLALVCFVLAMFGVQARINLTAAGLALAVVALLIGRLP